MDYTFQEIQTLSRIGSRGVFGKALAELTENYPELRVVAADVMSSARLEEFTQKASARFINVGIAEQNMIGISAGLASEGYTVVATSFAPFATMRCFEMIRSQIGYMNLNVKIVGLLSGVAGGALGNTHYGLEDIAIMRTIPNMTVLSPADGVETYKTIQAALAHQGPVYIRLSGSNGFPVVYKEDYEFTIGKGILLRKGEDIAIIATGTMVSEAIRAARALAKEKISVSVIDMHTIKPLDTDILDQVFKKHKLVVTIEEHFCIGGLGSAVAEYKATKVNAPVQLIFGLPDCFEKAGEYSYMLEKTGLTASHIAKRIIETYKELF